MSHESGDAEAHHRYDFFLSLAGPDRPELYRIKQALERENLTSFIDESDIRLFTGITAEIHAALRGSTCLVAYYSKDYPTRSACQFELTTAFLAAQRSGDPARRIIVVNPESSEEHIAPVELLDARFHKKPANDSELRSLARAFKQHLDGLPGPLGAIPVTERPTWYSARVPGAVGFVGRYREMWELHSTLNKVEFPLTQASDCGPVAALVGLAGVGKSALAASYAWQFGAAHLGGVYWIDLASGGIGAAPNGGLRGADAATRAQDMRLGYADRVRTVAETLGLPTRGVSRAGLLGLVGARLAAQAEPSLWIIDNVPPYLDPDSVADLLIPAGAKVRTLLISNREDFGERLLTVRLSTLSPHDGEALLRGFREPENDDEAEALREIAAALGGHPRALQLAGRHLRPRRGLVSVRAYLERIRSDRRTASGFGAVVRDALDELDELQLLVLRIAASCGPGPIPAVLLHRIVQRLGPPPPSATSVPADDGQDGTDALGDALDDLRTRLLAEEDRGLWSIAQVVRIAARDSVGAGPSFSPSDDLVAACVLELLAEPNPAEVVTELIGHARDLVERAAIETRHRTALLRRLAEYYESRGEAVFAAKCRERVLAQYPDSLPDLLKAAADHLAAGALAEATRAAERAVELAGDDLLSRFRAELALARTLDGLCRYPEADAVWARIESTVDSTPGLPHPERLAAKSARVHSLALHSTLKHAIEQARALEGRYAGSDLDAAMNEQLHLLKLELAWLYCATGDQRQARTLAQAVIGFYENLGAPQHHELLRAQAIEAEAVLTPELQEFNADRVARARAEATVRELWRRQRLEHGELSPSALTAAVGYGYALVTQGKSLETLAHLSAVRLDIERRLGDRNPLYHRAGFLLGWALRGLRRDADALAAFKAAFEGQRELLGSVHPHTLHSEYEYAVTLMLFKRKREADPYLAEVRRLLPQSIGYRSDLPMQVKFATAFAALLPSGAWGLFRRFRL